MVEHVSVVPEVLKQFDTREIGAPSGLMVEILDEYFFEIQSQRLSRAFQPEMSPGTRPTWRKKNTRATTERRHEADHPGTSSGPMTAQNALYRCRKLQRPSRFASSKLFEAAVK